jgi:asparagine synthase (glutamine-hydrolysing)
VGGRDWLAAGRSSAPFGTGEAFRRQEIRPFWRGFAGGYLEFFFALEGGPGRCELGRKQKNEKMCGIAGAIGAIDGELRAAVGRMTDAQAHRGPDDSGEYASSGEGNGVVLGFRRLAIIDLSPDGHQPMLDAQRGNAIVFNGEIYNYAELRQELEAAGEAFRSKSDTEVLLRAYGRWGTECLARLRGMFGFAIYDRAQRRVFLARDRLGIKPLYYAVVRRDAGKAVLFASEVRALLASGLVSRRLDPAGLGSYVWNGFAVGPHTVLRDISLLAPGGSLTVALDGLGLRTDSYWSLAPAERGGEVRSELGPADAVARLESELLTATRQHLVSDVPLGVFLSGGVDSSAVASLAVRAGTRKLKTFHIGFEEASFDESVYARRVARDLGTEHAEFRLTQERFCAELDQALASLDQPTLDAINTYFVSRVVREAGFTVALAGTGGDEIFGGYKSFRDLPLGAIAAKSVRVVPESVLRKASSLALSFKRGTSVDVSPQTRWAKLGDLLATRGDRLRMYQVAYALFTQEFQAELADKKTLELTPSGLPIERAMELSRAVKKSSALSTVSVFELALFLGERLLRDSDAASMAVSLELRVPLLDHRVVEAAQAVPDAARFRPLGKKRLLKSLAMPNLDHSIFERPKAGFVLPIEVWAKDRLARQIESLFADRALAESVGLRSEALGRLWRAFRSGAPGFYWTRVWAPYVLLNWCRSHRMSLG